MPVCRGIRAGIHTGPLTSGVIGSLKFAYDIRGDTVNTASRMESSGEEGGRLVPADCPWTDLMSTS